MANFVGDIFGVLGAGAFQKKDRGFVALAGELLQGAERHKKARAFAVLDDGGHVPIVIQKIIGVADFEMFGFRGPVVYQKVVGVFHVMPLEKNKAPGDGLKTFAIDAVNDVYA